MTNKFSVNNIFDSNDSELKREELDVSLFLPIVLGLISTVLFTIIIGNNIAYFKQLLTGTDATRNIVMILIFLSMAVIIFNVIKFLKVQKQFNKLRQHNIIPDNLDLKVLTTEDISDLIENNLSDTESLICIRCRRILQAYMNPRTKNAASDIALDDSSFYQSSSVASYSLPRTAIWAIPFDSLPRCYSYYCSSRIYSVLRNFTVSTANYKVNLLFGRQYSQIEGTIFTPISMESGESEQEIALDNSNFQQVLKTLNPETDFLYFLVRSDSFDTFEGVWNLAEKKNFAVGWNPMEDKTSSIIFGSNGRAIDCQSGSC